MFDGRIPDEDEIYLRQLGLGVKCSFFEYYYTEDMVDEEKELIDEKVKLTIEYLKERLPKGYNEYCSIYDENYQFIKGVKLGIAATGYYYKFKKTIKELINFYTLEELTEILKEENYDAILGMGTLPKRSFFEYFYTGNMAEEEKEETKEKVKLAIEYEKYYWVNGYEIFCEFYDKSKYIRFGIKKFEGEKRRQFEIFINRISLLIEPYNLNELREMCEDVGVDINSRLLQLKDSIEK